MSSFQLEFCPAFVPEVGVLTNVTQDHVYRHGSRERYAALKRSMFAPGRARPSAPRCSRPTTRGRAGRERARRSRRESPASGALPASRWRVLGSEWSVDRSTVRIARPGGELALETRLPGPAQRAQRRRRPRARRLCAIEPAIAADAIGAFAGVPGRFQTVAGGPGFSAIVDYAHNTDGLEQALATARALIESGAGELIAVVSALDFYDRDLSFAMGATAARLADEVILTTDRYRPDGPLEPEPALVQGASGGPARARSSPTAGRRSAPRSSRRGRVTSSLCSAAARPRTRCTSRRARWCAPPTSSW